MKNYKRIADGMVKEDRLLFFPVLFALAVLNTIAGNTMNTSGLVGIILWFALITVSYGAVTFGYKVAHNKKEEITIENDALIGFKLYTQLLPTYIMYIIKVFLCLLLASIVGTLITFIVAFFLSGSISDQTIGLLNTIVNSDQISYETLISLIGIKEWLYFLGVFIPIFVMIIGATIYVALTYSGYEYMHFFGKRGNSAVKMSKECMKGHKMQLLKLELSYILLYIAEYIINIGLSNLLGNVNELLALIVSSTITCLFVAYYFLPSLYTARFMFYEDRFNEMKEEEEVYDFVGINE